MNDLSFLESEKYNDFIKQNEDADTLRLRLKHLSNDNFDADFAIMQIECRQKTKLKLPTLYNILTFPTNLSIEQCTSETLAKFHAELFNGCDYVIDLTCGLGVDSYYISKLCNSLTSVEINQSVSLIADYNFRKLGCYNICVQNCDAEIFTRNLVTHVSGVFVDPSRRVGEDKNKRVYKISDCSPDLKTIIANIKGKADYIIVKASPMVDITQTLREFNGISHIWILSIKNECKELLFKIDLHADKSQQDIPLDTLNFEKDIVQKHNLVWGKEYESNILTQEPTSIIDNILYVPNSSIMKSGKSESLCGIFNIKQIAINSHLFTSSSYIDKFPGKTFRIEEVFSLSKDNIKKLQTRIKSANITCRNFPLNPDELRKKLKIKDGGENYIFATKLSTNSNVLILCKKHNANA